MDARRNHTEVGDNGSEPRREEGGRGDFDIAIEMRHSSPSQTSAVIAWKHPI